MGLGQAGDELGQAGDRMGLGQAWPGWAQAGSAMSVPASSSCPWMSQAQLSLCPHLRDVSSGLSLWVCQGFCFQRLWGEDVQGTVSAPCSLNSLCRLCREALPALLREGAMFCKTLVLVSPASLEGWGDKQE